MSAIEKADVDAAEELLSNYYAEEIAELAKHYPSEQTSLTVDYADVVQSDPKLADRLKKNPEDVRHSFRTALRAVPVNIPAELDNARVRFKNIYDDTRKVSGLRADDVDRLRTVQARLSKASGVRPAVKDAAWECQRCHNINYRPVDRELDQPRECETCERTGPFELDYQQSNVRNHQAVRLKQPPEEATNTNQVGNEVTAHIEGDKAGEIDAGQRAAVTGILRAEHSDTAGNTLEYYFEAQDVQPLDDDYSDLAIDEHRETIEAAVDGTPFRTVANSIAPGITGGETVDVQTPWGEQMDKYWWVRLAVGVANLFGSWRRARGDGTYERGSSHTLLIGDPSTGKSSIMSAATEISPRSASESGKNATGPGLTAAAVRDDFGDSEWTLEAGALVKANGGVAGIDEIDKMQKDGLSRLHSALERERLEVSKAGIDATLTCETSLLAAGNPDGSRFSKYENDLSQIDIVSSLMDRFDLVFTFHDVPDETKDRQIAESRVSQRSESGLIARGDMDPDAETTTDEALSLDEMQAWVALARQRTQPVIDDDRVRERLTEYYVTVRQQNTGDDEPDAVPATVRTLDGLLRLSEACARLRLSDGVEPIDAEMAIALTEASLEDIGYAGDDNQIRDVDMAEGRGSWSQKERIKKLMGIIETLQSDEGGADVENVVESAVSAGMDAGTVADEIEKMLMRGELYRPNGHGGGVRVS